MPVDDRNDIVPPIDLDSLTLEELLNLVSQLYDYQIDDEE